MQVSERSRLVDFDADAVLSAVRETSDDAVHLCVEYTLERFHTLYADEMTLSLYGDREKMDEHLREVHSYGQLDFTEKDFFSEMVRGGGDVRSIVTCMDNVILLRFFVGQQGFLLTADPDADVTALVEAIEAELD